MTLDAILQYLHISAILTLVVFLSSEAALCRPQWLNAAVVERLSTVDRIYGIAALAVLVTGIVRIYLGTKGSTWYWHNWLLHVKLTLFIVVGLISTGWQLADQPGTAAAPPARQSVLEGTILKAKPLCATGATTPFTPTRVSVEGVVHRAPVLALPRDSNNVPGVPPINEAGKHEFAWDRPPGVMPGSDKGNVLLNAHTWPWTSAPALGNLMLKNLRAGDRIVLWGDHAHLCYRVTKQVTIRAEQNYPPYYDTEGPSQVAIMVCAGVRRGPGDWADRAIWFATPVGTDG